MSKSQSNPTNTTSTSTALTTKNLNVSGNSGPSTIAEGGSTVTSSTTNNTSNYTVSTDEGAVASATALSGHALDAITAVNSASLSSESDLAKTAIASTNTAYGNAANIINGLFNQFGSDLEANQTANETQLGNVVSALTSSFESNNVSASQQAIQGTTSIVKYVSVAAIGGLALYLLLRKQ